MAPVQAHLAELVIERIKNGDLVRLLDHLHSIILQKQNGTGSGKHLLGGLG
jgi:hypothetical protein